MYFPQLTHVINEPQGVWRTGQANSRMSSKTLTFWVRAAIRAFTLFGPSNWENLFKLQDSWLDSEIRTNYLSLSLSLFFFTFFFFKCKLENLKLPLEFKERKESGPYLPLHNILHHPVGITLLN